MEEKTVEVKIGTWHLYTQEYEHALNDLRAKVQAKKDTAVDRELLRCLEAEYIQFTQVKADNLNNLPVYRGRDLPKPGDIIYVGSSWSIDHGETDVEGGKAKVKYVKPLDNHNLGWVEVWEHPGRSYGWAHLLSSQDIFEKRYGNRWAYPDPDYG